MSSFPPLRSSVPSSNVFSKTLGLSVLATTYTITAGASFSRKAVCFTRKTSCLFFISSSHNIIPSSSLGSPFSSSLLSSSFTSALSLYFVKYLTRMSRTLRRVSSLTVFISFPELSFTYLRKRPATMSNFILTLRESAFAILIFSALSVLLNALSKFRARIPLVILTSLTTRKLLKLLSKPPAPDSSPCPSATRSRTSNRTTKKSIMLSLLKTKLSMSPSTTRKEKILVKISTTKYMLMTNSISMRSWTSEVAI
mmetsp:Transcript_8568/g.17384  ORF Transcript_8568/g.17384 Transcript_8568/m.17384 type:complete len:254 (-) Transcript_8568:422-1183(-)